MAFVTAVKVVVKQSVNVPVIEAVGNGFGVVKTLASLLCKLLSAVVVGNHALFV